MKLVGYVRVSSVDQNLDRQLADYKLDKRYEDKVSGKSTDRPALQAALEYVREGDTLIVHSMDRLARNLDDLRKIVKDLTNKGVKVQFHKECLTFTGEANPMAEMMLSIMGAVAQFERDLIRERQREGIAIAKAKGDVFLGRKPSLSPVQILEIKQAVKDGVHKASIAAKYKVSRQTIYTALQAASA
jgi:DNA invertase Pin-like site-specific DNA recombinase